MMTAYSKYHKLFEKLLVFSLFILVFLYDVLNQYLKYFDEVLSFALVLLTLIFIFFKRKIKLYKKELYLFYSLVVISIIGLISNLMTSINGNPTQISAVFGDFVNFNKAFMAYFSIRLLQSKFSSERVLKTTVMCAEMMFIVIFIMIIADVLFQFFPQYQRFGLSSFQLFFTHTSRYSFAIVFLFITLFLKYYDQHKGLLILVLILGLLSLRVKFFGFFLVAVIFMILGKKLAKISPKTLILFFLLFTVFLGVIFKDQLLMYFSLERANLGWSRGVILKESFHIGNDFFPLGTGFGTYASYYSGKYYSWVYEMYGIDQVYGISKAYWGYIADQYWPMVLGQFGYLGLFLMLYAVYNIIMIFIIGMRKSQSFQQRKYMYAGLLGLLMLLIDSSSDAIFSQNRAVVMFILFGLFINSYKEQIE